MAEKVFSPRPEPRVVVGGRLVVPDLLGDQVRGVVASAGHGVQVPVRGQPGGQPVLAAFTGEQRPAAAEGQPRAGRDRLPLAAVAFLAVAVEARPVPERTVGGLIAQLTVDQLASHRITWVHRPFLDLLVNDVLMATINFELDIEFVVRALVATVRDGHIVSLSSGSCEATATLAAEGLRLASRRARLELPLVIRWPLPLRLAQG